MRGSDLILGAALALWAGAVSAQDAPPARVVSMNLCTDQLAMMLAAPGQLVSISHVARDPLSSAMADEATGWPVNHGLAEEIFLLDPDLVLAGTYSNPATVDMLRRLGIEVVQFAPPDSIADIRDQIIAIGAALGRQDAAAAMLAAFDADLARLSALAEPDGPRAALYYANGYTTGEHSLAGDIMNRAGFRNIADEGALAGRWFISLEELILAAPEVVITGQSYPGASNAEELLRHPALARLMRGRLGAGMADADWVCGTPHVLRSLARLIDLRAVAEEGLARADGEGP